MASQYKKIQDYPHTLWDAESPVLVEKMQLSRDTLRGINVLFITFRNMSEHYIMDASINITVKDKTGKKLTDSFDYHYYGMEIPKNKIFGSDVPIPVDQEASIFQVTVKRVDFENSNYFRTPVTLQKMPEPPSTVTLGEFEAPFVTYFTQKYPKIKQLNAPEKKSAYWRCICGRIYPHTCEKCNVCHLEAKDIFSVLNDLKENKLQLMLLEEQRLKEAETKRRILEEEARLQKLEEERLAKEEEEARRKKKKRRNRILLTSAILAALLIGIVLLLKNCSHEPVEDILPSESETVSSRPIEIETEPISEPEIIVPTEPSTEPIPEEEPPTPLAVIGSDLTAEDRRVVLRLIGMEEEDFERFHVIYITNEEEHELLDEYFGKDFIGHSSLSCLLITPTEPGSGLNISSYNITYCTEEMYREALTFSGITDAEVIVAGPFKTSGTSALTGALKAGDFMKNLEESEADETDEAVTETNP